MLKIYLFCQSFLGVVVIEPYLGDDLSRHRGPNEAIPTNV